jgi:hypothetical protein
MKRRHLLVSPFGVPLANRAVTVRNAATGVVVTTGQTDNQGYYDFTLADEAIEYWIDTAAGGTSSQMSVQAPASTEHRDIFVRNELRTRPDTIINFPAVANVLFDGVPLNDGSVPPGQGPLDPRYVQKSGDSMNGSLTFPEADDSVAVGAAAPLSLLATIRHPLQAHNAVVGNSVGLLVNNEIGGGSLVTWRRALNAADQKMVDVLLDGSGNLHFRALNDAYTSAGAWLQLTRGAGATAATINPNVPIVFGDVVANKIQFFNGHLWSVVPGATQLVVSPTTFVFGSAGYFMVQGSTTPTAEPRMILFNAEAFGRRWDLFVGITGTFGGGATHRGKLIVYDQTAGLERLSIWPSGAIGFGLGNGPAPVAHFHFQSPNPTAPAMQVQTAAGATGDALQVVTSAGGRQWAVFPNGGMYWGNIVQNGSALAGGVYGYMLVMASNGVSYRIPIYNQ